MAQALPTIATPPQGDTSQNTGPGFIPAPGYTPAPGSVAVSPTQYPTLPNGTPVKTADQIQSEADAMGSQPLDSTTPQRGSSKIESDFNAFLDKLGAPPPAPDTNKIQSDQNATPGGVNDLEGQLGTLQKQQMDLENSIQQQEAGEASKPGVVAALINGRMKMISAENANALNTLKANITSTATSLKNAQTAVATFMKNTQSDYQTAVKAYNDAYTKAYQAYTSAETNLNREQTAARANAQVIINSYKGASPTGGFASLDTPENEAQWTSLELQAGLPQGTIKAAIQNNLSVEKIIKGSDGNEYLYTKDANGNPQIMKVGYAGGTTAQANVNVPSKAKTLASKTPAKDEISLVASQLKSRAGSDGFISPQDWQTALTAWTNAGYSTASFLSNFKGYANVKDKTNNYAALK